MNINGGLSTHLSQFNGSLAKNLTLQHDFKSTPIDEPLSMDNPEGITPEVCEPGHVWNDETQTCEAKVSLRSPRCEWGYQKNIRLDECRRVKYNVGSQSKGYFRKLFDKAVAKNNNPPATARPVTQTTTKYTGKWYSYGSNYGRNDRDW